MSTTQQWYSQVRGVSGIEVQVFFQQQDDWNPVSDNNYRDADCFYMLLRISRNQIIQEKTAISESRKNGDTLELLKQGILMLSRDTNQMRGILGLQPSCIRTLLKYSLMMMNLTKQELSMIPGFKAVDYIEKYQKNEELAQSSAQIF